MLPSGDHGLSSRGCCRLPKGFPNDAARQNLPKSLLVYSLGLVGATQSLQMTNSLAADVPTVVLDTNAVLDWLLFQDVGMLALAGAIQAGDVRWVACARMRDEFQRTLGYANLAGWLPDSGRLLSSFDRWAMDRPTPPSTPVLWRCSDTDDQIFIDLALAEGARWLATHDRAVLRLARRARERGLLIVQPAAWRLDTYGT